MSSASPYCRVVVVHDYLTQRGGAERVVLALLGAFPGARLVTSIYDPAGTYAEFGEHRVETMWPDRLPFLRADPRRALPVLAQAFSSYELGPADLVVASSSGWAHGIATTAPKLVYCHNPARWLYQSGDYLTGRPRLARALGALTGPLRRWDRRAAASAQHYLANSRAVQDRVRAAYGIDAELLPPPAALDPAGPQEPIPGVVPGFLLTVSRARGYKNTALVCEAVAGLPGVRLLAVGGLPAGAWPASLQGVSGLSDAELRWAYAHCAGVVAVSREDFGLSPVEGYAFGRPAAVLQAGGYLDSSAPEASVWVSEPTVAATRAALVELLARPVDEAAIRRHAARFGLAHFQQGVQAAADRVFAS